MGNGNDFGFIPRPYHDDNEDKPREDHLHTLSELWRLRLLAEVIDLHEMMTDAHVAVFEELRRYADELAHLDPESHNAALAVGSVLVSLGYAETAQERLEALAVEVQRMMRAVAEAKRQRAHNARRLAKRRRLIPFAQCLFGAVLCGLLAFVFAVVVQGAF